MAEVILALDLPKATAVRRLLDRVPSVRWVKVGSMLFAREGPPLIRALIAEGRRVFLDLKWHDIPNTVTGAVGQARDLGVSLVTVHTLGGPAMLAAAARAAGASMSVVGVTVLTSHTPEELGQVLGRSGPLVDVSAEVRRLATMALEAGLAGTVCSPHEVADVRAIFGSAGTFVVAGIRGVGDAVGDQARVATAAQAAQAGATHLVVGRPILQAEQPERVFDELQREANQAVAGLPQ